MSISKLKSLFGLKAYVTKDDQVGARNGFVAGGIDKPAIVFPSPDTTAVFADFHGDDLNATGDTGAPLYGGPFRALIGDTGHTNDKVAGSNGVFRLLSTVSATAAKASTAGVALGTGALDYKANQGPGGQSGRLRVGARVKMQTVNRTEATGSNRMHVFVGFTDVGAYEFPAYDTGAGVISAASDYCGVVFAPGGDTGWSGVAGKSTAGDSGDQVVALDTGVAANVYSTVEVEIHRGNSDTGGVATFYVNGIAKGQIVSPVASATALTPFIGAWLQDTGVNYLDIDWVNISAPRDTGL